MEYKQRLKIRLYTSVIYTIIGIILIVISALGSLQNEILSSFGAVCAVLGAVKIVRYFRITKNENLLRACETAETDERNIMIMTKARSISFTAFMLLAAISVIVLLLLNQQLAAQIIAFTICGFLITYRICYFILSKKY